MASLSKKRPSEVDKLGKGFNLAARSTKGTKKSKAVSAQSEAQPVVAPQSEAQPVVAPQSEAQPVVAPQNEVAAALQEVEPFNDDDAYFQKMVWIGTSIPETDISEAEKFFLNTFDVRMRYLGTIVTKAGQGGEGGRNDAVFFIHKDDVMKFATARFQMGNDCPRWWEDYVDNNHDIIRAEDISRFEK